MKVYSENGGIRMKTIKLIIDRNHQDLIVQHMCSKKKRNYFLSVI